MFCILCVQNISKYVTHKTLNFWKMLTILLVHHKLLGNPIAAMFLHLTFMNVYLIALIQYVLPVITVMPVYQYVHLVARMYNCVLLAFKTFCVDISRKTQNQCDTNKNHVNFLMVPFLVYINQFLPFLILVS